MLYELLALVRSLFVAQIFTFTGVLDDPRSDEDKEQDYLHEERASAYAAPIPDSFSNPKITESPYPIENQWRTSSCVPHGTTLALGIERKADGDEVYSRLSPLFTYRLRSNYGREGSSLPEMLSLGKKVWCSPLRHFAYQNGHDRSAGKRSRPLGPSVHGSGNLPRFGILLA